MAHTKVLDFSDRLVAAADPVASRYVEFSTFSPVALFDEVVVRPASEVVLNLLGLEGAIKFGPLGATTSLVALTDELNKQRKAVTEASEALAEEIKRQPAETQRELKDAAAGVRAFASAAAGRNPRVRPSNLRQAVDRLSRVANPDAKSLQGILAKLARHGALTLQPPEVTAAELLALLQSEVGTLFLDRTAASPDGFVRGEFLWALPLGGGEEAIYEQKSYTETQQTNQVVTDTDQETNAEISSKATTELTTGMKDEQTNTTGQKVGGSVGTGETAPVQASISAEASVANAHTATTDASTKLAFETSRKVAARFRQQHKTDFKIATTDRYENTAKRTVRNPNAVTPITYVFFKLLQRFSVRHERRGARACWAPPVIDPGFHYRQQVADARTEFLAQADQVPLPSEPLPPTAPGVQPQVIPVTATISNWGPGGTFLGTVLLDPAKPAGMHWDGNAGAVLSSLKVTANGLGRPWYYQVLMGPAQLARDGTTAIHVLLAVSFNPYSAGGSIDLAASFRYVGDPDPAGDAAYQAALADYQNRHMSWEGEVAKIRADARALAESKFLDWKAEFDRAFQPTADLISRLVETSFPPEIRDTLPEIELWHTVFDFERISYRLYSSWWANDELHDPMLPADDFANASWARLFVPVRPGMEAIALRWIHSQSFDKLGGQLEARLDKFIDDLKTFRKKTLGDISDDGVEITITKNGADCPVVTLPAKCLGTWTEDLPTDGTHMEVLHAATSAADATTGARLAADVAHSEHLAKLTEARAALVDELAGKVKSRKVDISLAFSESSLNGT